MKLFSVATLAGIAIAQEDQWDTSFQGKFKLDKDEDAYKTFQSMLARAENDGRLVSTLKKNYEILEI